MSSKSRHKTGQSFLAGKAFTSDAANQKIMSALNYDGLENARYVGGCVRNSLLGEPVKDIDIATKLWPREVIAALEANNIRYAPTGIEHGTISAIVEGRAIEITTLRKDTQTDGRRAKVQFTDDWATDAQRRDFTCNALYCDSNGHVDDPLGSGIDDTLARKIVFIGKACERIQEDYLRILRFFRLYAWYGKGEIDQSGIEACKELKEGLSKLSAERVWSEIKKLLSAANPIHAIEKMDEIGIFKQIIGEEIDIERFKALVTIENELVKDADPVLRFMALLDRNRDFEKCNICEALRLSNDEKNRLRFAATFPKINLNAIEDKYIQKLLYKNSRRAFEDSIILQWSIDKSLKNYNKWRKILDIASEKKIPVFPIGGKDLLGLDVPKGPKMGLILAELENWWIEEDFPDDLELLKGQLKQIVIRHD